MNQPTSHFDNLEISGDVDALIVYLEAQSSMMPDKLSQKYLRMKSIVETIKKMKRAYDEVFGDNMIYLNALLEKGYFTAEQIDKMIDREKRPPMCPVFQSLSLKEAAGLLSSVKKTAPEPFDINKHSHLIKAK